MIRARLLHPTGWFALFAVASTGLLPGCASKKFVRTEVAASELRGGERVTDIETQVEQNQTAIRDTNQRVDAASERLDQQGNEIQQLSQTARDALDRALAAGKLAEGRLISETVLSSDAVKFGLESTLLSDEAKTALNAFAAPLANANQGIYVEIQGHTDSSGDEQFNLSLGEQRAEAVRRYLASEHEFPLHRMSVISYGETEPAYDNASLDGRVKNRRVVLVVLR
jgi:outer membrane protein OmpA-like peptidoglycan-associated protein